MLLKKDMISSCCVAVVRSAVYSGYVTVRTEHTSCFVQAVRPTAYTAYAYSISGRSPPPPAFAVLSRIGYL